MPGRYVIVFRRGLLAVEHAHAPHEEIEQEERDGGPDEARPEVLVVADHLARRVEHRRRRGIRAPPPVAIGRVRERRHVGREREVLARIRVRHVAEALGDRGADFTFPWPSSIGFSSDACRRNDP